MSADTDYMRRALALARRGLEQGAMPIAAILVCRGEVLGEAIWREQGRSGLLGHPEHLVMLAADATIEFDSRREATLYTTLEPCLMCMGTAMSFFLGRVVFAMESPADGAATVADEWNPRNGHPVGNGAYAVPQVEGGICRDEASGLISEWLEGGASGPEAEFAKRVLGLDASS